MKQYFQAMLLGPLISMTGNKKMGTVFAPPKREDYLFLIELYEAGKLAPAIDRGFPLSEVPEALRYYGEGHAQGKVVITVEHNGV
jgi:NADPH:quinone reductase-like Zn-dependent oxidoreductase